jgi:hypothetical protein
LYYKVEYFRKKMVFLFFLEVHLHAVGLVGDYICLIFVAWQVLGFHLLVNGARGL